MFSYLKDINKYLLDNVYNIPSCPDKNGNSWNVKSTNPRCLEASGYVTEIFSFHPDVWCYGCFFKTQTFMLLHKYELWYYMDSTFNQPICLWTP